MLDPKIFTEQDPFARHCGMEVVEIGPGRSVARMRVRPEHLNFAGLVHGGVVFSLADLAFAAACNSHGTLALAINVSISFLKPAPQGLLTASAEEVVCGPKLGNYLIRVTDEAGEAVALFTGTAYRKKDPVPGPG